LEEGEGSKNAILLYAWGSMDKQAGISLSGDEMVSIGEMFQDGPDVSLHDGGGRFASEGQDIVDGEGGGAPVASEEGDRGFCNACMLSDICPDLFKEGSGISIEGFVESYARMTGFASDDPSGRSSCF